MTRKEFINVLREDVQNYIDNFDRFDGNPQLMINPDTLDIKLVNGSAMLDAIADSEEAVEDAAFAEGAETKEASDYQVTRNPDFYAVTKLLKPVSAHNSEPSEAALKKIADVYFK